MYLRNFYYRRYHEALKQEQYDLAERYDKQYTKIRLKRESNILVGVLLAMIVITIVAPFVIFFIGRLFA